MVLYDLRSGYTHPKVLQILFFDPGRAGTEIVDAGGLNGPLPTAKPTGKGGGGFALHPFV